MIEAIRTEFCLNPMMWTACALLAGVFIGHVLGMAGEAKLWRGKGGDIPAYRTAMCSAGRFYYVVPEREFVDMSCQALAYRNSVDTDFREVDVATVTGAKS